jgi:hypothetical protein
VTRFLHHVRRFGAPGSLLEWLVCLVVGHTDVLLREPDALRVRCLRCERTSRGIPL